MLSGSHSEYSVYLHSELQAFWCRYSSSHCPSPEGCSCRWLEPICSDCFELVEWASGVSFRPPRT